MPITQERMLTCINAGLSAFNALELARQILTEQIINIKNRIPNSGSDIIPLLETLQILLMPETLVNTAGPMSYIEAWHQLQMEARHFREFKSTNIRAKRYQQNKRKRSQTNPALTNEPSSLAEEAFHADSLYQSYQQTQRQNVKAQLNKMQKLTEKPQIEDETDYRNYQPEEFE